MRIICRACVKGWTQRQTEVMSSAEKAGSMLAVNMIPLVVFGGHGWSDSSTRKIVIALKKEEDS